MTAVNTRQAMMLIGTIEPNTDLGMPTGRLGFAALPAGRPRGMMCLQGQSLVGLLLDRRQQFVE
jgi:hypothetical protein